MYYWLPLLAWMGAIFYLSAQPKLSSPPSALLNTLIKKGAHMAEYAILMLFWWRALAFGKASALKRPSAWEKRPLPVLILALGLTMLYATGDEFHQTFVPGRHGSIWDVIIDSVGVAIACGAIWFKARDR